MKTKKKSKIKKIKKTTPAPAPLPKRKRLAYYRAPKTRPEKRLTIDASKERDRSVLPQKVNGGFLSKHNLLTPDKLAEEIGGRSEFVNMCRLSEAPEAIEFVRLCETDKDVSLDHILDHMNMKLGKILESVVPALCEYGGQVGKLINALKSPAMMKESIRVAIEEGVPGFPDRRMQLEIAGIIQPKAGININLPGSTGGIERPEATYSGVAMRVDEDEELVQPASD